MGVRVEPQELDIKALLGSVVADRIRLEELLGIGAMGAVFRGHHQTLDKSVAVKVLKRSQDGAFKNDVFAREARTAARLDHPNIVNVIDFGEDGPQGLAYIAMEFLQGRDLEKILREEGPMDCARLARLMVQATGAMAAAHFHTIVHRDLKPANLMVLSRLDDDGRPTEHVKVCDFGLAKIVGLNGQAARDTGPSTLTAAVVGTPAYMSPEQAVGEALDERSDIYSLGIVMYEMACGVVPFDSESYVGLLTQHVTKEPKPVREIQPTIPPKFAAIIHRCLEKMREDRFATARDLRTSIQDFLRDPDGSPITVAPPQQVGDIVLDEPVEFLPLEAIVGTGSSAPVTDVVLAEDTGSSTPLPPFRATPPAGTPTPSIRPTPPPPTPIAHASTPAPSSPSIATPPPRMPPPRTPGVGTPMPRTADLTGDVPPAPNPPMPKSGASPFPPLEGPPAVTSTGDDLELLIAEAVDDVRHEIQRQSQDITPELDPFEAAILEELNAGKTTGSIDRRHHAAALSERAQYMWRHYGIRFEPHEGDDPYFVMDHRETLLGPLAYTDAMRILAHVTREGHIEKVQISADEETWVAATKFLQLTGQELVVTSDLTLPPKERSSKRFEGKFFAASPVALMGRVAREQLTGRFFFEHQSFNDTERVVLHVSNGAPTFVYSSDTEMQLPRLLLSKGILAETVVPVVIHRALQEDQPLGVLIARDTGIDLGMYRSVFMKERLAKIFSWPREATFVFVPGPVGDEVPFAGSTLAVLPDIVYRSKHIGDLTTALHPLWSIPIQHSERFPRGIRQMGLSRKQLQVVKAFRLDRTLGECLNEVPIQEQQMYYTMAYILIETELLLKPIGL